MTPASRPAIAREIASQPGVWRRAADLAAGKAALPGRGERVAVAGCGTSLYMAQAYARHREDAGHGETDAFPASELPGGRRYGVLVALSRSGTTTEVLRLLESRPARRTLAITATGGSPVTDLADETVVLDFADEDSVVQTRFATASLALLRASTGDDLDPVIADGARALEAVLPAPEDTGHFVFLGRGWVTGLAREAALKLQETAGAWAEAHPSMEYRHGPISVAGRTSFVWSLDPLDASLRDQVLGTGATIRSAELDPMAELVLVQRTALERALAAGLDPDHPRGLERSVVLSDEPR